MPTRGAPPAQRSPLAGFGAGLVLLSALAVTLLPAPAAAAPDYIPVAAPTLGSSNWSPGQPVSVSVGIKNQGDSVAASMFGNVVFRLNFYYSTDTIITSLDPTLDATDAGACRLYFSDPGVGQTTIEALSCILPSTADGKDYTIGACIAADNSLESNFANNCSAGVLVTANRPDWAVIIALLQLSAGTSRVVAGQQVELFVQSQSNRLGGATEISGTIRYYFAADASLSTDRVLYQGPFNRTHDHVGHNIAFRTFTSIPSSVTPGATYYGGACLSVLEGEVDTANNCLGGAVPIHYTDWQVSSVTISDTTVGPGQTVALSVTVSNADQSQAGASTLRYYLSTDDALSTSLDTALCETAQPALSGNSSRSVSVDCQLPASLTRGATYYLFACLDAVAGEESSTDNNCSAGAGAAVSIGYFDWTVAGSVSIDDTSVEPGQSIALGATVRNVGGESAGATTLRFYWSTDSSIETTDTQLCAVAVPSLDSGSGSALSATTCAVPAAATAGDYHVGACVDTQSGEQHSGDSDNCSAGVAVGIDNFDWTVAGSVSIDETSVEPGQSIALGATVQNVGGVLAGATTLRFYWSTDSSIETTDTQLCAVAVPSLDSGSGATLSAACAVPAAAEDGDYHVGACVDTQDGEESVANNCSAGIPVAVSATSLDVDENASVDSVDATLVLRVLLLPGSIRESLLAGDASVAGLVVAGFPALAANEAAIVGLAVELGAQGAGSDMDVDQNASVDSVDATLVLRVLLLPGSIRESLLAGDASVAGLAVAGFPALAANEVAIVNRVLGLIGN